MARPIDPTKPAQLHLKKFPAKLRLELDTFANRRAVELGRGVKLDGEDGLVAELLRLGMRALRERGRRHAEVKAKRAASLEVKP